MEQVVSFAPRLLYSWESSIHYPLHMRLCGCYGEEHYILTLTWLWPSLVQVAAQQLDRLIYPGFPKKYKQRRSNHHNLRSNRSSEDRFLTSWHRKFCFCLNFTAGRYFAVAGPSKSDGKVSPSPPMCVCVCVCVNSPPQDPGPRGTGESSALVSAVCDWWWGYCNTKPVHRRLHHFYGRFEAAFSMNIRNNWMTVWLTDRQADWLTTRNTTEVQV